MNDCEIKWAVFDYGGVLAEEGFVNGLHAIAEQEGLDGQLVYETTREIILSGGYLVGKILEESFWNAFRRETKIRRSDQDLRNEILSRFKLRPWMLQLVSELRTRGVNTAILSDQVNWLDELDVRDNFFKYFDRVYNSFHVGLSKNDPAIFEELVQWVNCSPGSIVFIDDYLPHIKRARSRGLNTIHYTDRQNFIKDLQVYCPDIS
jgi:epoxide hydrolase-like predicted phosphatase